MLLSGACTNDREPETPATTSSHTTPAMPNVFSSPPGEGEVRVVETGFSVWHEESTSSDFVSFGIIIENTTNAVAVRPGVDVWLTDADGERIPGSFGPDESWLSGLSLARIRPGQQLGVGDVSSISEEEAVEIAGIEAEVADPEEWEDLVDGYWLQMPVTASDVATEHDNRRGTTISFVNASYTPEMLTGHASGIFPTEVAIFRDSRGAIVGGYQGGRAVRPPGQSAGEIEVAYGHPPETDDSRTEIHLVPGP